MGINDRKQKIGGFRAAKIAGSLSVVLVLCYFLSGSALGKDDSSFNAVRPKIAEFRQAKGAYSFIRLTYEITYEKLDSDWSISEERINKYPLKSLSNNLGRFWSFRCKSAELTDSVKLRDIEVTGNQKGSGKIRVLCEVAMSLPMCAANKYEVIALMNQHSEDAKVWLRSMEKAWLKTKNSPRIKVNSISKRNEIYLDIDYEIEGDLTGLLRQDALENNPSPVHLYKPFIDPFGMHTESDPFFSFNTATDHLQIFVTHERADRGPFSDTLIRRP